MNKMTKKLFRYFTVLLLFFAITSFIGFSGIFRYFTYHSLESGLKARAGVIASQMEQFLETSGTMRGQGRGAYLRFINDIAMADAYIIDANGNPFTFGSHTAGNVSEDTAQNFRSYKNRAETGNLPGNESLPGSPGNDILEFAMRVFSSGNYEHAYQKAKNGMRVFYAGMPVCRDEKVYAAVVIRDAADISQESLFLAVWILGVCLILTLLVSGVFSIFLSRRFIKPIHQIARTTKELARGNYTVSSNVHDQTELGELATETDLLAEKLEAARQESSRLEQMQKNYISNISHELRTPVTVIRSSLEAVCDGIVTGEKAREYERQILAECVSLQRLINDMLELSRLQHNDFPIEKENMDLSMALDDAVRAVRVLAKDKSISIRYEKEDGDYFLEGDYGRLRQMFVAALDNAIKYSPKESEITVTARKQDGRIHISIKDCGCGIPPEDQAHIFERFYRSSRNRGKGSGLGLAIMKGIADRHQIEIRLESSTDSGTEVLFLKHA